MSSSDPVDRKRLRITGRHQAMGEEAHVLVDEQPAGVVIVITQAFGPRGDSLIGLGDATFDGHPAVSLMVEAGDRRGLLHLSPIHGDTRKSGFTDIAPGTKCRLLCPVSGAPLDQVPDVAGDPGTDYFAIYLTPQLSLGSLVAVSDVWGHYHSRIVNNFELISLWDRDR